jgi:hypothetical protein
MNQDGEQCELESHASGADDAELDYAQDADLGPGCRLVQH